MSASDDDLLAEIANQRAWIKKCGGDLAGYISHYDHFDPDHPVEGESPHVIYTADTAELERLVALAKERGIDPNRAFNGKVAQPLLTRMREGYKRRMHKKFMGLPWWVYIVGLFALPIVKYCVGYIIDTLR
jgi:hypothetical protein